MKPNTKKYQENKETMSTGCFKLRVWDKKATKKRDPHLVIKCGCCDEKVEIYYENKIDEHSSIEINGVIASVPEWRKLLLPILGIRQ